MIKTNIKLIIFDLSDVCFNSEEPLYLKIFAERHKINLSILEKFYLELLIKAEEDKISGKEIWQKVFLKFNIKNETFEKVLKEMMTLKEENPETMDLIKKLRKKGYKITYLTNYNKDYWEAIKQKFDLNPYFDYGLVSYQIKARKPSPIGFKKLMDYFAVKPAETIFTDDSMKNLLEAEKLGINTIHFQHVDLFADLLEDFGINLE